MKEALIAGTRRSRLAQLQTQQVLVKLRAAWPELEIHTEHIVTEGDRISGSLRAAGKGAFTGALEEALMAGQIDIAVHSLKDLPVTLPSGLALGAICLRSSPRDVLVSASGWTLEEMPPDAAVGTSSIRRAAQLRAWRPGIRIIPVRGNVDTRLRKMHAGEVDALVLAEAGLKRLCLEEVPHTVIPFGIMLPAPGQGALAVECRKEDKEIQGRLTAIDSPGLRQEAAAERSFLRAMGGGCATPVAAYARAEGDSLVMDAAVIAPDGSETVRVQGNGTSALELGSALAAMACARGARRLIQNE